MASNKTVKVTQLSKDTNIKLNTLVEMLLEMGIDKKTGASLEAEEFELFMDKLTRENQIENLDDYLDGKATIVSEEKEKEREEAKAKA